MAEALRERGAAEQVATLVAEGATCVFRGALARWYGDPERQDLRTLFRDGFDELSSVLANRPADHALPTKPCRPPHGSSCSCVAGSVRVRPSSSRSIIWRAR